MSVLVIGKKKYSTGFEWHAYSSEKDAGEKVKTLKKKGFFANYVKVNDRLYQVYSCEKGDAISKHPPLAVGFLHLAGGYYYMDLGEQGVWVLLKGMDGSVLHEKTYRTVEEFENSQYALISSVFEGEYERKKITVDLMKEAKTASLGKSFKNLNAKVLVLVGLIPVLGASILYVFGGQEEMPPPVVATPSSSSPSSPQSQPQTVQSVDTLQSEASDSEGAGGGDGDAGSGVGFNVGKLDLSCYKEYYRKALLVGTGSCEWTLTPDKPVSEVEHLECGKALRLIVLPLASVEWGQPSDYGELAGYTFVIEGQVYMQDLKRLNDLYFKELKLKIEGEPQSVSVQIAGELICKKDNL